MSAAFTSTSYQWLAGRDTRRTLELFCTDAEVGIEVVDADVLDLITAHTQFDEVLIVGDAASVERLCTIVNGDNAVRGRLRDCVPDLDQHVTSITFDADAKRHVSPTLADENIERYKRLSLTDTFVRMKGLVTAPRGYHYRKPSGAHSSAFLRASNVLENTRHVAVLTFWLLPFFGPDLKQIKIDTSAISVLALALGHEARRLGLAKSVPTFRSFASYSGVREAVSTAPSETLFLISASTSGGLADELIAEGAAAPQIVTLFYLGAKRPHTQVVCNLSQEDQVFPEGLRPIASHKAVGCPMCAEHSFAVRLEGDQFALEAPPAEFVMIGSGDIPKAARERLERYAGTGFFLANRATSDQAYEIYLNVEAIFRPRSASDPFSELQSRWTQFVKRGAALHTRHIIYTTRPFSLELATQARELLQADHGTAIPIVSSRELKESPSKPGTAALVIASCIDRPAALMAINLELREKQPRGNVTYITPMFRAASKGERDRQLSNLTHGEWGPNTYSLFTLDEIDLPNCRASHSWHLELVLLREIRDWADEQGLGIPSVVEERLRTLERIPTIGMSNELFWASMNGTVLRVRSDFVLLNTAGGVRDLSQADVFVVLASTLHHLRAGVSGKRRLGQRGFQRGLLAPHNFQRFNDGVIQASILRASHDHELAYGSCDTSASQEMYEILAAALELSDRPEGEALVEFVIALLLRRLTLDDAHELALLSAMASANGLPDHLRLFARYGLAIRSGGSGEAHAT